MKMLFKTVGWIIVVPLLLLVFGILLVFRDINDFCNT